MLIQENGGHLYGNMSVCYMNGSEIQCTEFSKGLLLDYCMEMYVYNSD